METAPVGIETSSAGMEIDPDLVDWILDSGSSFPGSSAYPVMQLKLKVQKCKMTDQYIFFLSSWREKCVQQNVPRKNVYVICRNGVLESVENGSLSYPNSWEFVDDARHCFFGLTKSPCCCRLFWLSAIGSTRTAVPKVSRGAVAGGTSIINGWEDLSLHCPSGRMDGPVAFRSSLSAPIPVISSPTAGAVCVVEFTVFISALGTMVESAKTESTGLNTNHQQIQNLAKDFTETLTVLVSFGSLKVYITEDKPYPSFLDP